MILISHISKQIGGVKLIGNCDICHGVDKPLLKHKKMYICSKCKEIEDDKATSKIESKKHVKAKKIWSNWGLR